MTNLLNISSAENSVTAAELATVKADLEASIQTEVNARISAERYKGTYATIEALTLAYPSGSAGDEANIDAGIGSDIQTAYWDTTDSQWVIQTGSGTAETATSVLAKYSANAGVEPYTTSEQTKVAGIESGATKDQTGGEIEDLINLNGSDWHLISTAEKKSLKENVYKIVDKDQVLDSSNTNLFIHKYIDGYWYDFKCIDGNPTVDPVTIDTDKWSLQHDVDEIFWHSEVSGYFTKYVQTVVLKNESGLKYKYDLYADLDTAVKRTTNPSSAAGIALYHPHTGSPQG